jgi:hypothetical protein
MVQNVNMTMPDPTLQALQLQTKLFPSVAVAILFVSEPIEVGLDGVGGSKQQL